MELRWPTALVWFFSCPKALCIVWPPLLPWHWSILKIVAIGFMLEPKIKVGNKSYHIVSPYKLIGCIAVLGTNQGEHWRVHLGNKIFGDLSCANYSRKLWEARKKRNGCDTKDSSWITEENQRELLKMAISTFYFILAHPIHSARNDQIHFSFSCGT